MSNPSLKSFIVDAFTNKPFQGNPAAVCILPHPLQDQSLQKIAAEFNLSETAFLLHEETNRWQLRWFTPICEIKLCGHATLAAAHVLARELHFHHQEFIFLTLSGELTASISDQKITLNFPKIEPTLFSRIYWQSDEVGIKNLNLTPLACYQAGEDIIIELATEDEVFGLKPEIEQITHINTRGLILTAASNNTEQDFVSRFFAPRVGINEDPVTGSAHCSLASLWSTKLGKNKLRAMQLSARTGMLDLICHETRVSLIGECVTFLKGEVV